MTRRSVRRITAFFLVASLTATTLLAPAQTKRPLPTAPAKRPANKPPAPATGGAKPLTPDVDDAGAPGAPGALGTRDERAPSVAAAKDSGAGGNLVESKTLDGGTHVMRFGEVAVEGRLKSPQIVYFLRRVRAEFAAGDLGHRTFLRELSETRNDPGL